jgi:hypothetical protein
MIGPISPLWVFYRDMIQAYLLPQSAWLAQGDMTGPIFGSLGDCFYSTGILAQAHLLPQSAWLAQGDMTGPMFASVGDSFLFYRDLGISICPSSVCMIGTGWHDWANVRIFGWLLFYSTGILEQAFVLPQPGWFMHGEIITSSRLSLSPC